MTCSLVDLIPRPNLKNHSQLYFLSRTQALHSTEEKNNEFTLVPITSRIHTTLTLANILHNRLTLGDDILVDSVRDFSG